MTEAIDDNLVPFEEDSGEDCFYLTSDSFESDPKKLEEKARQARNELMRIVCI